MQRLDSLQLLRGVAAFAVLVFHVCTLSTDYAGSVFYAPFTRIGEAGVDLFFVISGFVMSTTTYDNFDTPGTPRRFAIHRLSRIYPPYWILSAFLFLYYIYNPTGVNSKQGGVNITASFLLAPSSKIPLLPVAWTLVHEMFFYTVFFLALCFVARRWFGWMLFGWATLIIANLLVQQLGLCEGLALFLLHPFNLEFIAGAAIGLAFRYRVDLFKPYSRISVGAAIVMFCGVAVFLQNFPTSEALSVTWRVVWFGIPALLLVAGSIDLQVSRQGWRGVFTRMGDYSYSLYLVHILIIHFAYRVITRKFGITLNFSSNAFLAIVLIVTCIFASKLYYRFIEKPSCAAATRLLSNFLGRKKRVM